MAVTPIEGLELPYWSGVWLGLYPTWQGLTAQGAALVFVIGSYVAAEACASVGAPAGSRPRHSRAAGS